MNIPNRLARECEELVTHRFETGCMGLASPADLHLSAPESQSFWSMVKDLFAPLESKPVPAVCIPPGASLRLMDIPTRLQREFGLGPVEEVTFTQLTATANRYRDAVRFSNGHEVLLQLLREGQRAHVVSLGELDASELTGPTELVLARTGELMR